MQITFSKVKETFPKKTYRSERALKKMHLGMYAETLASIRIDVPLFDLGDKNIENACLDAICEYDNSSFIFTNDGESFTILTTFSALNDAEPFVEQYITNLLCNLTLISMEFASVENITVEYGDAYYGEW